MDDLTDQERRELLADLASLVDEIERILSGVEEGSRPVDLDEPIGRLSRMDAIQQQKMAQRTEEPGQWVRGSLNPPRCERSPPRRVRQSRRRCNRLSKC